MLINYLFLSFLSGLFLADYLVYQPVTKKILLWMLILLLVAAFLWRRDRIVQIFSLCSLGLISALFYFQFFVQKPSPEYISYYNGQNITVVGEVADEPLKNKQKTKLFIKMNGINGKILVNAPLFPEYHYGDRLKIKGKLEEPPIFDEFNYRNYLKPYGVYAIINSPEIEKVSEASRFSIKKNLFIIKAYFENTLNKILPGPEAALANGLVLGTRQDIPDWLLQAFVAVGIIHIIALSGYNITIITKYISAFFNPLLPRLTFWLTLVSVWFFVVMVGASASIVRAALMGSMYLIAHKVGRRREMSRILLLTAFLMVLANPFILKYDIGFQLSFLATIGLIYLAPVLENRIAKWQIPNQVKEAGVATLSAQLFTLPLLLFNFKQISLIAPLTNILILPLVPYAMFVIFLTGIAGMIFLPLGQLLGWVAFLFLKYIILISVNFAKIPGVFFRVDKFTFLAAVIYWLALGFILKCFKTPRQAMVSSEAKAKVKK